MEEEQIVFIHLVHILIFLYNDKVKSLSYKSKIELPKRHFFHNIIENKNGNVVILENNPGYRRCYDFFTGCQDIMSIWKENNNKFQRLDNYKSGWFYDLKNINERLFLVLSEEDINYATLMFYFMNLKIIKI